jgi:hypothetical protein
MEFIYCLIQLLMLLRMNFLMRLALYHQFTRYLLLMQVAPR